ncbi:hypothetical protein EYB25_007545 [Talaromyces marneffei]|nr:hypothetical protein EYB25_007545 [Talaromyces marneffei]
MTSTTIADWIVEQAGILVDGRYERLNALTTDTCSTMRSTWADLQQRPQFSHVFMVPCDSHGLQLLIKDLLTLPSIDVVFKKCQSRISHFNHSPLQLSILRAIQMEEYGEEKSLLSAIITRWGSQYTMLQSIKRSEAALSKLARREDIDLGATLKAVLEDDLFWIYLGRLIQIIKPLHEAIKMSESVKSDMSKVLQRWLNINRHLLACQPLQPFSEDIEAFSRITFRQRLEKQLTDMHYIMYYLDPKNCHTNLQPQLQRRVNNVISKYCSDSASAVAEFVAFRTKSGVFFEALCWDHTADPKLFWRMHQSVSGVSSGLGNLALRFLNATANSIRNRLTIEHADKLNFIYINSRALNEIMSNQPNTEEIAVLEIEAENDFIDTWKISQSVMDLEYNDREEKIEESQVSDVAGPLILI